MTAPSQQRGLTHGRRLLTTLLMSVGLGSCANGAAPPTVPIEIPFAVDQEGCVVALEFQVKKLDYYSFNLTYVYKDEKPSDNDDRSRVWRLVGGGVRDPVSNKRIEPGAPLVIHLTVTQLTDQGELVVFDKEMAHPKLSSWGETLNARLAALQLPPGRYRFMATSLKAAPALKSVRTEFSVYHAYMGK
ncbi:DUF5625 family protein [Aquabacterium sp.]|uniref:DUF5625 family protein n=1 Tax=Aquabacterium sp. TaxID=1872578 RepID=UPI0035AFEBE3